MAKMITVDGNTAAAMMAYAFSDAAAIYPITPSSPMAEMADEWAAGGRENLFGQTVKVVQLQSEAGAAGTLHGMLISGALGCTFTAGQGLLLMIPNMFRMAGELLPAVFHVSARALSTHALSIFGDQTDVMACRGTGFAMLCSSSVQEAADMAAAAHLAALESSVPFLHFFDGFRTSHEIQRISVMEDGELRRLVPWDKVEAHRARGLNPEHPMQSGTAQNPDIYFQNREACNRFYRDVPENVQRCFDRMAEITGRRYHLFDYAGAQDAQDVLVLMGSGAQTAEETSARLNRQGWKTGVVTVRLYRPFCTEQFLQTLPPTVKRIAVLDRCKEPGAQGEPLYQDVCAALKDDGRGLRIIGGRYGLGGKDFTPAQVKAVYENLRGEGKTPFTVGIEDDVTGLSLKTDEDFDASPEGISVCKLYGFGSDGTVGACKAAVKLIGDRGGRHVQAFFAYDSRKSGGLTVSHLRFGDQPIRSAYLAEHADYVACHNPAYAGQYDMVSSLKEGGTFLLNCPWDEDELDSRLPASMRRALAEKKAKLYLIDAGRIAREAGLAGRISTVMLTAFFRLTEALPFPHALEGMKESAAKTYARQGEDVIRRNQAAMDAAADALRPAAIPSSWLQLKEEEDAPGEDDYLHRYIRPILEQQGDRLPVSLFNPYGLVPTGTSRYEKRSIAPMTPKWLPDKCIQCNLCSLVCPHACIRPVLAGEESYPEDVPSIPGKGADAQGRRFRVQVSPRDCTGCTNCVQICPAPGKALVMEPFDSQLHEAKRWEWAMTLPEAIPARRDTVRGSQFLPPLFEFSGACAGCGETPYIKLTTQLFGDRMMIANATGCSSIFGGSSPTCPYTVNRRGHGPAWANSLFEDNAEFGLGMHLALQQRRRRLAMRVKELAGQTGREEIRLACGEWLEGMNDAQDSRAAGERLQALLKDQEDDLSREILRSGDLLTKKSVWMIGGDGWAYDIGFGGVDHVLASGEDVNMLVLDTEVYSNTGGQASKATPRGAAAKFAHGGKKTAKKDLGRMAMTYGSAYVAQVSMGADPSQLLRALTEAESYSGPSLVICYAPCINHGVSLANTQREMRRAVESGYWTLYRFDPRKEQPLTLDSRPPQGGYQEFLRDENRYASLLRQEEGAEELLLACEQDAVRRRAELERMTVDTRPPAGVN